MTGIEITKLLDSTRLQSSNIPDRSLQVAVTPLFNLVEKDICIRLSFIKK
ncbi:MAG: hypothetical protein GY756_06800 [bacterium]|nr:hypothetical protein [bacterium]